MNVLRHCFHDLFVTHGHSLFSAPEVMAAESGWGAALAQCQQLLKAEDTGYVGRVTTPPGEPQRVTANSMQWVLAHCNQIAALQHA